MQYLLVAGALSCSGCAQSSDVTKMDPNEARDGVRKTLGAFQRALLEDDYPLFRTCFTRKARNDEEAIRAMFDFAQSVLEFRSVLRERFGPDAWAMLREAGGGEGTTPAVPPVEDPNWVSLVDISLQDGKALAILYPGTAFQDPLVHEDGAWRFPQQNPNDPEAYTRYLRQFRASVQEATEKARDGADMDSIKRCFN